MSDIQTTLTNDAEKIAEDAATKFGGPVAGTVTAEVAPLVLPAIIEAIEMLFSHIGAPKPKALMDVKATVVTPNS